MSWRTAELALCASPSGRSTAAHSHEAYGERTVVATQCFSSEISKCKKMPFLYWFATCFMTRFKKAAAITKNKSNPNQKDKILSSILHKENSFFKRVCRLNLSFHRRYHRLESTELLLKMLLCWSIRYIGCKNLQISNSANFFSLYSAP